jgi:phosphate starvation-inducible protein PhoH and related proteins
MNTNDFHSMGEPKKRKGKSKKLHEKVLLKEFNADYSDESEYSVSSQKRLYENIQHLSATEKRRIEDKFTHPKNGVQRDYHNLLSQRKKKIVVATGPAGTGKTLLATEMGIKNFLFGNVDKLIFTRPSVTVDEDLGYLPGTLEEKMAPWVRPIYDILYNFISPKEVTALIEEKVIEISPLGFMRGRTFKNCWIIADEMQNSSVSQMKMLLTRLGENTRLVITGDLDQPDRHDETNGLDDFLDKFKGKRSASITSVEFDNTDIQREEVVKEVLEIYSGDIPCTYDIPDTNHIDEDSDTN